MSGFSNKQGGGSSKYANFKDGMIVTKVDGEKKQFTTLEGDLLDIDVEDAEYENKPYRKINLYIQHDAGVTILGMPLGSGYGQSFCKICPNIDVSKPIMISGGIDKIEGSAFTYGKVYVSQDEKYVKWFYTKTENAGKFPKAEEITIGKGKSARVEKDYTKRDEFCERLLYAFHEKLAKVWPNGAATAAKAKKDAVNDPTSDLPF